MMSITRFRVLAGQYGADLTLWPEAERLAAMALLYGLDTAEPGADAELAEHILASERPLDAAIQVAFLADAAKSWEHGEQDAALERMRADIGRRIAAAPASGSGLQAGWSRRFGWSAGRPGGAAAMWGSVTRLRSIGLAAGSGLVVASGLCIGLMLPMTAPRAPADLFGILQTVPIEVGR